MAGLADVRVRFTPGAPFLPFQQLLAVLPAASCRLLPKPFEARPAPSKPHRKESLVLPLVCPCILLAVALQPTGRLPSKPFSVWPQAGERPRARRRR